MICLSIQQGGGRCLWHNFTQTSLIYPVCASWLAEAGFEKLFLIRNDKCAVTFQLMYGDRHQIEKKEGARS